MFRVNALKSYTETFQGHLLCISSQPNLPLHFLSRGLGGAAETKRETIFCTNFFCHANEWIANAHCRRPPAEVFRWEIIKAQLDVLTQMLVGASVLFPISPPSHWQSSSWIQKLLLITSITVKWVSMIMNCDEWKGISLPGFRCLLILHAVSWKRQFLDFFGLCLGLALLGKTAAVCKTLHIQLPWENVLL